MRATMPVDVSEGLLASLKVHEGLNLLSISKQPSHLQKHPDAAPWPRRRGDRMFGGMSAFDPKRISRTRQNQRQKLLIQIDGFVPFGQSS
jgi:hypothetical protein